MKSPSQDSPFSIGTPSEVRVLCSLNTNPCDIHPLFQDCQRATFGVVPLSVRTYGHGSIFDCTCANNLYTNDTAHCRRAYSVSRESHHLAL
jgi:hypothetical protein